MDLTRTRRALQTNQTEDYQHADMLLDALDIIQEDAQESLEDQMRLHQQGIRPDNVQYFLERSVESLVKKLLEVSDTETILTIIVREDLAGTEATLDKLKERHDWEKSEREKWATIGDELGDLDDHPF